MLGRELLIACLAYTAVSVDVRYSGQWAPVGWEPRLLPMVCVAVLGLVSLRRRVLWAALIGLLADVTTTGWLGPQVCCACLLALGSCLWLAPSRRLTLSGFVLASALTAVCMSLTAAVTVEPIPAPMESVKLSARIATATLVVSLLVYCLATIALRLLPRSVDDGSESMNNRWPMLTG